MSQNGVSIFNNIYALRPSLKMCYLLSWVGEMETQKTSNARVGNEKVDQLSKSYRNSK